MLKRVLVEAFQLMPFKCGKQFNSHSVKRLINSDLWQFLSVKLSSPGPKDEQHNSKADDTPNPKSKKAYYKKHGKQNSPNKVKAINLKRSLDFRSVPVHETLFFSSPGGLGSQEGFN